MNFRPAMLHPLRRAMLHPLRRAMLHPLRRAMRHPLRPAMLCRPANQATLRRPLRLRHQKYRSNPRRSRRPPRRPVGRRRRRPEQPDFPLAIHRSPIAIAPASAAAAGDVSIWRPAAGQHGRAHAPVANDLRERRGSDAKTDRAHDAPDQSNDDLRVCQSIESRCRCGKSRWSRWPGPRRTIAHGPGDLTAKLPRSTAASCFLSG